MQEKFADNIATKCLQQFELLTPKGKPIKNVEWTHLACICSVKNDMVSVVSLATGTKCLGAAEVNNEGFSVNDSHAEVLCRRAFVRFLFKEMEAVVNGKNSSFFIFDEKEKKFAEQSDLTWHIFLSHTPCGDASIFPKSNESFAEISDDVDCLLSVAKRQKLNSDNDIHRTGAKCVSTGFQDPQLSGSEYHTLGCFRTKPGRGDKTLSMSCSDKLTKWCVMGVQGCLPSEFLSKNICISSIVIGNCPFSEDAFIRAVIDRNCGDFDFHPPSVVQSKLRFTDGPSSTSKRPCPASIVWHLGIENVEVLVNGYKQGVTKSRRNSPSGASVVCRRNLFDDFMKLKRKLRDLEESTHLKPEVYSETKLNVKDYSIQWAKLKKHYEHWIDDARKLKGQQFKIEHT